MTTAQRFRGSLLGLAAGDALGTAVELQPPGSFAPVTDMAGGGPFDLEAGQWTDDTSMALCLAQSLVETGGFDPVDQLERYVRWWRDGHLSSTGECFDVGVQTAEALRRFAQHPEPYPGATEASRAGNGSIMRLAPVPLRYAGDVREAIERSGESSRTTHGAETCVDACRYLGALLAAAATGTSKEALLDDGFWTGGGLHPEVEEVARGSYKRREPPEISGAGYVVRTLEAALWALHRTRSFRDGALLVVNLGDDADTTGAVYGQLAGALYGEVAIPAEWRKRLALRETIERFAGSLHELAGVA